MATLVRPARESDADFVAWVQQTAARSHVERGFWDVAFPGTDAESLAWIRRVACAEPVSFCHWSRFLIAEVDGTAAAALSGYEPRRHGGEPFVEALSRGTRAGGWTTSDIEQMYHRTGAFMTCAPETPDESWVVEWVATLPEFRGRGLVKQLLDAVLEEGRKAGYQSAQISLLIGNTPAEKAYEGAGFQVKDERRHPDFEREFASPGIRRMTRPL